MKWKVGLGRLMKTEIGSSSIETPAPMALLDIIGVASHGALATTSNSRLITDEPALAEFPPNPRWRTSKSKLTLICMSPCLEIWR